MLQSHLSITAKIFLPIDIRCNAMYYAAMLTKELVAASTELLVLSIPLIWFAAKRGKF